METLRSATKLLTALALASGGLCAWAGDARAQDSAATPGTVLFSEDFESYAVGSLPEDYVIVFNGLGTAEQRVETDGGNRHLRTAGQHTWGLGMHRNFDFDLPQVVSVSWRMRVDNDLDRYEYTDPSGARYASFGGFGVKNTDEVAASVGLNKYASDGRIVAWCPQGTGSRPEVQLGVWTEFRMDVDFAARRYSMYKDGEKFCERDTSLVNLSYRWNFWGDSSGIHFSSGNSGSGASVTRFDDIVIRERPVEEVATRFSEDFESYAVGSLPEDYVIVFNGLGTAEQRVETDGGNRHLRTAGRHAWGLGMHRNFDFDLPQVVSVSWRMRVDNDLDRYEYTDPSGARYAHFGGFGVKNTDEIAAGIWIDKYETNMRIVAACPQGDGSRPEVQLGAWTEFRMDVDFAAGRYSMYKDGEKFCERDTFFVDLSFRWNSWGDSSGIHLSSGNSGSGASVTRFDDIVIREGTGDGQLEIKTPVPISPLDGESVDPDAVAFVVHIPPVDPRFGTPFIHVRLEVATDAGFVNRILRADWPVGRRQRTEHPIPTGVLTPATQYYWRVRAYVPGNPPVWSHWSAASSFRTAHSVAPDRAALEAFYHATDGPNWSDNTNWLTDRPLDEWAGVSTRNGRVVSLNLYRNRLRGQITASIADLADLEFLALHANQLNGPIPDALGNLTKLEELHLHGNQLSGPIPDALGNLTNLEWLNLSGNPLGGPIPGAVGNLANIENLYFADNQLSGPIPDALGNLPNLKDLNLSGNQLSGPIPGGIGSITSLENLILSGNKLSGPIPDALSNLANLKVLLIDSDTGLCLALYFPLDSPFARHARAQGVSTCAPPVIDVGIFYTPAAREAAGGREVIEAEIESAVLDTNLSLENSRVHLSVNPVFMFETDYAEVLPHTDFERLWRKGDGFMDDVHFLRDYYGADVVHVFVASPESAGKGTWAETCGTAGDGGAFGLTRWDEMCSSIFTFAHELGHNLSLRHDRHVHNNEERRNARHPYSFGYVNLHALEDDSSKSFRWRTVMAYQDRCQKIKIRCDPIPFFSNTWRIDANGHSMGVPCEEPCHPSIDPDGPADAVRTLRETGSEVAARRASRVGNPFLGSDMQATIEATHLTEIRTAIGIARRRCGLPPALPSHMWTDPKIVAGETPIKAVHLLDARSWIEHTLRACGLGPLLRLRPWTDPDIVAGVTPVKAVHFLELRAFIHAALWAGSR